MIILTVKFEYDAWPMFRSHLLTHDCMSGMGKKAANDNGIYGSAA